MATLKSAVKRSFAIVVSFAIVLAMIPAFCVTGFAAEPGNEILPDTSKGTLMIKTDSEGNKFITGVDPVPCRVNNLLGALQGDSANYAVIKGGEELAPTDYVGTGCVVNSVNPDNHSVIYDSATVVIYGDVNGDAAIDAYDAIELDLARNGMHELSSLAKMATDIDGDGVELKLADYAMLVETARYNNKINQVRYAAPTAVVTAQGPQTIVLKDGTLELNSSYLFKATETAEEVATNPYKTWKVDLIGTVLGADIPANAVVFAGQTANYNGGDWYGKIAPAIKSGTPASLSSVIGVNLTYEDICTSYSEFQCGVGTIDTVNKNATLKLELRLVNPDDNTQYIVVSTVEMPISRPEVVSTNEGAQVVSSAEGTLHLDSVYSFATTETAEEAANSLYKNWKADIIGTVVGADIPANAVVFAGQTANYNGGDWYGKKAPALKNGASASLSSVMGQSVTYQDICTQYSNFRCGVGVIGDVDVNATLKLELRLVNPDDITQYIVVSTVEMPIGHPKAIVTDGGAQVVSSAEGSVALSSTYTFKATETAEEVATSPYKNWKVDLVGTVVGADIPANAVVFAGQTAQYNGGDWYGKIAPALRSGASASLASVMGENLTYEDICTRYSEIQCGVGALTSTVDSKIKLELRLVNPDDSTQYIVVSTVEMPITGCPQANITNKGPQVVSSNEGSVALSSTYTFKATETAEEVATSPYKNWKVDLFGTVVGADIPANAVVFAGQTANYNGGDWYGKKAPALRNGQSASLSSVMGESLTYEDICTRYSEIQCGVGALKSTVDSKIKLELRLVNPDDITQYIVVSTVEMDIVAPEAEITVQGPTEISTSGGTALQLDSSCEFKATETAEEVATSPYKNWKVDLIGTVVGADIPAGTVVFAGQTDKLGTDWITRNSPAVKNGQSASLSSVMGQSATYEDICKDYGTINVGVADVSDSINATLKLELRLVNPDDSTQYIVVSTVEMPI